MIDIDAFHRKNKAAFTTDGQVLPITTWFDDCGDECGPFDHPVAAVAGPDDDGLFWSIDLTEFDPVVMQ